MAEHVIFPHGKLEELAPGLWQVKGSLKIPLPRNMTVVRLRSGGLLIYSAVAMDEAGMKSLEALGTPELMVVPHAFHLLDAPFYKARYPAMKVAASADAAARLGGSVALDGTPVELLEKVGIRSLTAPGMKYDETILDLDVPGGRALVFTDLFGTGIPGLFGKLLGAPGGTGVPRIVKFRQVADKAAVRAFLEGLAKDDLKLILVSHGEPLTSGCQAAMRSAAARI